jgi:diaminohydroxyphosphoribosylaminopyrimidine deaminase / 5-amino-6-(5-phosphoribosylamino)uracil reductase
VSLINHDVNPLYQRYMAHCLQLARHGWGTTTPNPMVGAVVLDAEGRFVADGYHVAPGTAHAEAIALERAGDRARGGTVLVNLEPCNHHGRTPPCTEAILEAGIKNVVIGALDPNPHVSGGGQLHLQKRGVKTSFGVLGHECLRLNEMFFHHVVTGRPFVTLKMAMTLDGRTATRSGQSQWITNDASRQYVHYLRSGYDAILTTAETVLADNPQLTARYPGVSRQPIRIILDRRFRLDPRRFRVFDTQEAPVWVVGAKSSLERHYVSLAEHLNIRVLTINTGTNGIDLTSLMALLGELGVTSLWVEAGGRLAGSLVAKHLVNKFSLFYGPKVINDALAKCGFSGPLCLGLNQAPSLYVHQVCPLDQDTLIEAYPVTPAS